MGYQYINILFIRYIYIYIIYKVLYEQYKDFQVIFSLFIRIPE
jgi:hypothetical protein